MPAPVPGYRNGVLTGGAHWTPGGDYSNYGGVPSQMSQETRDLFAAHTPPAGTSGSYSQMNPSALVDWSASSHPLTVGGQTEASQALSNYNNWWNNAYGFTPTELTNVPSYTGTNRQDWTAWATPLIQQYGRTGTNPLHPNSVPQTTPTPTQTTNPLSTTPSNTTTQAPTTPITPSGTQNYTNPNQQTFGIDDLMSFLPSYLQQPMNNPFQSSSYDQYGANQQQNIYGLPSQGWGWGP